MFFYMGEVPLYCRVTPVLPGPRGVRYPHSHLILNWRNPTKHGPNHLTHGDAPPKTQFLYSHRYSYAQCSWGRRYENASPFSETLETTEAAQALFTVTALTRTPPLAFSTLGPLGFEGAQHRQTRRHPVDGIRSKSWRRTHSTRGEKRSYFTCCLKTQRFCTSHGRDFVLVTGVIVRSLRRPLCAVRSRHRGTSPIKKNTHPPRTLLGP